MSTNREPVAFAAENFSQPVYDTALQYLPSEAEYPDRLKVASCAAWMATLGASPVKIARAMKCHRHTARKYMREAKRLLRPLYESVE